MKISRMLAGVALAAIPTLVLAAVPSITDNEEHVFRGFFDRQSGIIALDRVALEKGSADVKTFAQSELDMISKFASDLGKLGDKFGLITRGMTSGGGSPKLGQGMTRGFAELPADATWFSKSQFSNPLAMGDMGGGAAPPAGGAPAGAPPAGAAPQGAGPGAGPGGAAPGGAGGMGAGGGPQQNRYDYDAADLQKLSGKDFDKQYLLRVAVAHNAILRHVSSSISESGANPDLVEFSKSALKTIAQQNQKIESLLSGQGLNAGPPAGARPQGEAGAPPAAK